MANIVQLKRRTADATAPTAGQLNVGELAFNAVSGALYSKLQSGTVIQIGASVAWTNVTGRPTTLSAFTNDAGYITGITSGNVTTALGYTPYNATNPSGYITSSGSITGNAATAYGLNVHAGRNNEANRVVRTDANGYIQAGWINTDSGDNGTTAISRVYASQDGYIRYYTPANFAASAKLVTQMDGSRDNTNYNSRLTSGFFNGADAAPNKPGQAYAQLITVRGVDTGWQLAGGYANNTIYTRGWHSSGTFYQWYALLSDGNFNSYAPTLTGTGASGTWAINVNGSAGSVPASGISGQTGMWTSAARPGPYRLYRRDDDSAYNVQTYWTGTRWRLRGYLNDSFHAEAETAYADAAGSIAGFNNPTTAATANTIVYRDGSGHITGNQFFSATIGYGLCGVYDSTKYQGVFAMGSAYALPANGAGVGNSYCLAWSHPNAGGVAGNLDSHGLLVLINGQLGSAISYSIVAAGNVTAYSDERLKTNWRPLPENFVDRLSRVRVGIYDRTDGPRVTQVGVSAQSLRELLPDAVTEAKDEIKTLAVSYGNAALAATVELAKELVALRSELAALKQRLA